ncbi:MAG: FtsW/RodA/SpoVE family cell cycle protein [Bacteroidetes bacterium]|nr:FtsW/RodA/SpoVE family cell cycle protein [Bacteroidota bacterium]
MHNNWLEKYFKGDRTIWLVVFILTLFSLLAVYSSTGTLAYKYQSGDTEFYLFRQARFLIIGLALMYLAHRIRYNVYSRLSQIGLFIAIPLLLLTLIIGTNLNSASRWLSLPGLNTSFQTSDLAKLALIMFVARMLSRKQENIKDFKTAFLPIMLPVLIVCGLILPANLSTSLLIFFTSVVLMFIGRINMKYVFIMCGLGVVLLSGYVAVKYNSEDRGRVVTWINRVKNFSSGEGNDNYQADQAKIAIATGGLVGKFPGNSTQRNFLPHPYSDFIFAIIIEEYGFLFGGVLMIFLYLLLFFRVIRFINHSPRAFATLLAVGCSFMLVFQAMINMAVAVNLFPVTGQPLPLVSMGGTSTLFTSIALGIILSVSREVEKEKKEGGGELAAA